MDGIGTELLGRNWRNPSKIEKQIKGVLSGIV